MFLILRVSVLVGFGFYLGISYKDGQMQRVCDAMSGDWNGTICANAEGS
ncbi:hypothetical protein [uncultured Sulfitobacter sp.]|nr:hypothetical protein [uncultured Sulfitobacter sp.]